MLVAMAEPSWVWIVLLFAGGIFFAIAEILIPSYGILTLMAVGSLVASVVFAFMKGETVGVVVLIVAVLMTPLLIYAAIRVWPHTPVARRIILPGPEHVGTAGDLAQLDPKSLVGKTAVTKTKLRPAGKIAFGDRIIDCVTEGEMVGEGARVQILKVEGNRVVVRSVEETET